MTDGDLVFVSTCPISNGLLKDGLHHLMAMMAIILRLDLRGSWMLDMAGRLAFLRVMFWKRTWMCIAWSKGLYNSPHVTATYSIWKKMLCQGYWQGIYSRVYLNPWGRDLSPIPLHFLAWLINFPAGGCPSVWSHGTWLWITGGMHIQALEWVAGCVRILEHPGEN